MDSNMYDQRIRKEFRDFENHIIKDNFGISGYLKNGNIREWEIFMNGPVKY